MSEFDSLIDEVLSEESGGGDPGVAGQEVGTPPQRTAPPEKSRSSGCTAHAAVGTKCKICGKVHPLPKLSGVDALGGGVSPRQKSPAPGIPSSAPGGRDFTPDFKKGKKK